MRSSVEKQGRTATLIVRLTPDLHARLADLARVRGVTMSDLVRSLIRDTPGRAPKAKRR